MGLGKTLQMLAVLLDRAHLGPSLVIAPYRYLARGEANLLILPQIL